MNNLITLSTRPGKIVALWLGLFLAVGISAVGAAALPVTRRIPCAAFTTLC